MELVPWSSDWHLLAALYKSMFKWTLEIRLQKDDNWRIVKLLWISGLKVLQLEFCVCFVVGFAFFFFLSS